MPPPLTLWNKDNAETKALFDTWSKSKTFRHPQATKDVFWLNYRVTSFVLALFVILSSMYGFYDSTDSAIQCYHDKGLKLPKKLLNRYCWMMSTFTLPKYFHTPTNETIYPGVGPFTGKDEKMYHAYYQWVPLFLFFQCACFYAPQALWKCMEGGRFKKLVESLFKKKKDNDDDGDDDEDAGEKGGKTGASCPPKCMCKDNDKKGGEKPLPFGLCQRSKQPDAIVLADLVEFLVKNVTNEDFKPMVQHLSNLPRKYRVPEMRSYLVERKPLNMKQVVECFQGKLLKPNIVKYLVERVSYLDTGEFIEWIENGPEEISPLDMLKYLLTQAPEEHSATKSKSVLVNHYNEHRCQDMNHYICEIASFVNLIVQIMLTNLFLDYQFFSYGFKALTLLCGESKERTDILSIIFPTMTKCTFHKYGPSGTIETLDSLCVLGVNIINEKIFLFLWVWFFLLAVCSLGNIIYQTYLMFKPDYEPRFLQWIKRKGSTEIETIEYRILMGQLIYHLNFSDWLILYLYTQSITRSTEWKSVCYLLSLAKILFPKEDRLDNMECWRWSKPSVRQPGFLSFCSTPSDPVKHKYA
ncbi:innexin inx2-like [Tigriopus californicus]|uniref:innexin inx2-like n=1 Tax=Tigriopus californicus TaxID=6832 RepID=UPI0027DA01D1|nr:innexin inx2-like [Tigriopus californicus]